MASPNSPDVRITHRGQPVRLDPSADLGMIPSDPRQLQAMKRRAQVGTSQIQSQFFSPFRIRPSLETPTKRVDLNEWYRYYFKHDPYVATSLHLHATYPLSDWELEHEDKGLAKAFNEEKEHLGLEQFITRMALEYFVVGECLLPGTPVTLCNGSTKPIEKIERGDRVITHLGNVKRVTELKINHANEIYEIDFIGKPEPLKVTGNHPIYVYRKDDALCGFESKSSKGLMCNPKHECTQKTYEKGNDCSHKVNEWTGKWVKASELKIGDFLVSPVRRDVRTVADMTLAKARFYGYYLSEGCLKVQETSQRYCAVEVDSRDETIAEDMYQCALEAFGKADKKLRPDGTWKIIVYSTDAAEEIGARCGRYSDEKELSESMIAMAPVYQEELLIGYLNGDGWVDKSTGSMQVLTISKQLAEQIRHIMIRLGIESTIKLKKLIQSKSSLLRPQYVEAAAKTGYTISVKPSASLRWKGLTRHDESNFITSKLVRNRCIMFGEGLLQPITHINVKKMDTDVFNLEVEDDHSYIAGGVAVHNCFPFGFLDDPSDPCRWERFILLDPDKIKINKHPLAVGKHNRDYFIRLEPDADLKKICENGPNHPNTGPLYRNIPLDLIESVKKGQSIPLHPLQVSHFKREINPFNVRGESIISCILQDLMYLDKIRDGQWAVVDRHIYPKEFYLLGEAGNEADEAELQAFNDVLQQTYYQPNPAIIWHHALKVQFEGATGKVLPLAPEFDFVEKRLVAGLMMSKAYLHGEGPSFANASVALDVLIARYMKFRKDLERWVIGSVFDPYCRMNAIYAPTDAEISHRVRIKNPTKKPWVPIMRWERGAMRDDQFKIGLYKELVDKGFLPRVDMYRIINKNPNQAKRELEAQRKEDEETMKEGGTVPGQPQMAGGGPGLPSTMPKPGGGGGGGDMGPPKGLPPGAPKLPIPGGGGASLPNGTPALTGAGTGPSLPTTGGIG